MDARARRRPNDARMHDTTRREPPWTTARCDRLHPRRITGNASCRNSACRTEVDRLEWPQFNSAASVSASHRCCRFTSPPTPGLPRALNLYGVGCPRLRPRRPRHPASPWRPTPHRVDRCATRIASGNRRWPPATSSAKPKGTLIGALPHRRHRERSTCSPGCPGDRHQTGRHRARARRTRPSLAPTRTDPHADLGASGWNASAPC